MKTRRAIVSGIILTIAAVGQIVLTFFLYNKTGNIAIRNAGWGVLWLSAIFGWLPIYTLKRWGGVPKGKGYIQTTELVDRGIYAIVRHPQYVAGLLMSIALVLIAQHWIVGLLGAIAATMYYVDAFEEEKTNIARFGKGYREYMEVVPRVNFVLGFIRALHRPRRFGRPG